jgi:disulfide bond formation protein DsbB
LHGHINSYTDPIYEAMGMDPSQLALWQRYGMLGAGALGGAGALMGNPYMMGAGAAGIGAGLYPHFGGMMNPALQQHTGYHLPGTNPWVQRQLTQPGTNAYLAPPQQ